MSVQEDDPDRFKPVMTQSNTQSNTARFEFRCWPVATSRAPPLQDLLGPAAPERRTDLYVVLPRRTDLLCKLRDGERLQIKTLAARDGRLECWTMPLDSAFPLDQATRQLCSELLGAPPDQIAAASSAAFVQRMQQAGVAIMPMRKTRRQAMVDGVKLESTLARAQGRLRWTVALEGRDAPALATCIGMLGLSGLPNESYAVWLADLLRQSR
ncbi:hypothetical protein [Blastomonas sp.]|uniref:hypothetical protein n=1 Tax=Blastomonas sp. TaxID=1909299 RepID=UPI00391D8EB7